MSDFLAAENHVAAWVERNREHQSELQAGPAKAGPPCDLTASMQIAKWAYQQTEKANGQVGVTEKVLKHLNPEWTKCFAACRAVPLPAALAGDPSEDPAADWREDTEGDP